MPEQRLAGQPTLNRDGEEGFSGGVTFRLTPAEWARDSRREVWGRASEKQPLHKMEAE